MVVSDLFDPAGWREALEELARKKYQLLVVHVLEAEEMQPDFLGEITLVDAEGSRERRLFVDPELARRFQEELTVYLNDIEATCASHGIDYLRTTTRGSVRRVRAQITAPGEQRDVNHDLGTAIRVAADPGRPAADSFSP